MVISFMSTGRHVWSECILASLLRHREQVFVKSLTCLHSPPSVMHAGNGGSHWQIVSQTPQPITWRMKQPSIQATILFRMPFQLMVRILRNNGEAGLRGDHGSRRFDYSMIPRLLRLKFELDTHKVAAAPTTPVDRNAVLSVIWTSRGYFHVMNLVHPEDSQWQVRKTGVDVPIITYPNTRIFSQCTFPRMEWLPWSTKVPIVGGFPATAPRHRNHRWHRPKESPIR